MHFHHFYFLKQTIKIYLKKKKLKKSILKKESKVPQIYRISQYRHLSEGRKIFASGWIGVWIVITSLSENRYWTHPY